jgi:hypothetical protein
MLLYRHSARCPKVMHMFMQRNPHFWPFVPMRHDDAMQDNSSFVLPASIPNDPTSPIPSQCHRRSDHDVGTCMIELPPLPNSNYTFSLRQCAQQFQLFRDEQNPLKANMDLDLYNASIVAVRMLSLLSLRLFASIVFTRDTFSA